MESFRAWPFARLRCQARLVDGEARPRLAVLPPAVHPRLEQHRVPEVGERDRRRPARRPPSGRPRGTDRDAGARRARRAPATELVEEGVLEVAEVVLSLGVEEEAQEVLGIRVPRNQQSLQICAPAASSTTLLRQRSRSHTAGRPGGGSGRGAPSRALGSGRVWRGVVASPSCCNFAGSVRRAA